MGTGSGLAPNFHRKSKGPQINTDSRRSVCICVYPRAIVFSDAIRNVDTQLGAGPRLLTDDYKNRMAAYRWIFSPASIISSRQTL